MGPDYRAEAFSYLGGTDFDMQLTYGVPYLAAAPSKQPSSSGESLFLLLMIVLALVYFMVLRPNQRRRMQALRQGRAIDVGDEVIAAGMVGKVVDMADNEVSVEVSDGVVIQFVPQAVQSRAAFMAGPGGRGPGRPGPGGRRGTGSSGAGSTADHGTTAAGSWPEVTGDSEAGGTGSDGSPGSGGR
jgi:preprotein translocase subunit YajC